jgi:hypothetical protein
MITFRIDRHATRDTEVVEILDGGRLLGTIYPQDWGIRIVSKYLDEDHVTFDGLMPPVLEVKLP